MAPTSSGPGGGASCPSPHSSSLPTSLLLLAAGACAGACAALSWRHLAVDRWRCADERGSVADGVAGLVGHTPLVRIRSLSEATGCEILAKAEFSNPGGSVKDRVAAAILSEATAGGEAREAGAAGAGAGAAAPPPLLRPGGLVTEGTAGSTGVSLAMLSPCFGVRAAVWMPDDAAEEKSAMMEALGARVTRVRPCSISSPEHFVNLARAAAAKAAAEAAEVGGPEGGERREGSDGVGSDGSSFENGGNENSRAKPAGGSNGGGGLFADQFENPVNALCHERGTGEEIWRQTRGKIDAFVCGAGTGGTLAGVATALKKKKKKNGFFSLFSSPSSVAIVLVDPQGSSLFNAVTRGVAYSTTEAEGRRRTHQVDTVTEGVGLNRVTANFARALPLLDGAVTCSDSEAAEMARHLLAHDGLFVGSSAAVNCVGAVKVARAMIRQREESERREQWRSSKGSGVLSRLSGFSPSSFFSSPPSTTAAPPVVVTLLCDGGGRHLSKFHNGRALREAGVAAAVGAVRARNDVRFVLETNEKGI